MPSPRIQRPPVPEATQDTRRRGIIVLCVTPVMEIMRYAWELTREISLLVWRGARLFRSPLAHLAAVYIIMSILSQAGTIVLQQTTSVLSSSRFLIGMDVSRPDFCNMPVVSYFLSCPRVQPSYSNLVDKQTTGFQRLHHHAVEGTGIARQVQKLAVIDLPTLINMVNKSDLNGREALVDALNDVGEQAIVTSRHLQKFSGAVREGLATVIGTNKAFAHRLERAAKWTNWSWLWPSSLQTTPEATIYHQALRYFEEVVDRLNMASSLCNHSLDRLQALLNAVERIVRDEHSIESSDRKRLLAELWTLVGGNRRRLAQHDAHITRLEQALNYEAAAKAHVADATYILDEMSDGILELKRKFSVAIDPTNADAVEMHYMVLAEGVRSLMEIQAHGKEADRSTHKKVWLA